MLTAKTQSRFTLAFGYPSRTFQNPGLVLTEPSPGPREQEEPRLPAGPSRYWVPPRWPVDRLLDPFPGELGLRSKSSAPGIALSTPLDLAFAVYGWAAQGHHEGRRG